MVFLCSGTLDSTVAVDVGGILDSKIILKNPTKMQKMWH